MSQLNNKWLLSDSFLSNIVSTVVERGIFCSKFKPFEWDWCMIYPFHVGNFILMIIVPFP